MSIVTKTGDKGETSLFGGGRVPKNNPRVASYGSVDEFNCAIGVLLATVTLPEKLRLDLQTVQKQCFVMGSELATPPEAAEKFQSYVPKTQDKDLAWLESLIIDLEAQVPPQRKFILPGGAAAAAWCFWIRTLVRRAERSAVALAQAETISPLVIKYLNRLSDYFFILGRWLNKEAGMKEVEWEGGGR